MFVNRNSLLVAHPIKNMFVGKHHAHGTSFGLSEAGYDIRIRETIVFVPGISHPQISIKQTDGIVKGTRGRFILASTMEVFQMPFDLVGTVRDKSSWARRGVSVFNTIIEPGWNGILTLELVFHGNSNLTIPAGSGIAQVLFGRLECNADYGNGKYQDATGIEEAKS
jgi:dCTP deaminase